MNSAPSPISARARLRRRFRGIIAALTLSALGAITGPRPTQAVAPVPEFGALEIPARSPELTVERSTRWSANSAPSAFEAATGRPWSTSWSEATGFAWRTIPASYDAAAAAGVIPPGMVDPATRAAMLDADAIDRASRHVYGLAAAADPRLPRLEELTEMAIELRGRTWFALYEQQADGLPVEEARASFVYSAEGRLLSLSLSLVPSPERPAEPRLALDDADEAARAALEATGIERSALTAGVEAVGTSPARREPRARAVAGPNPLTHLAWLPLYSEDGRSVEVRLVYVTRTEVTEPRARWRSYVDAVTGEVLRRENEVFYAEITGHSSAEIQLATPFDPFVALDVSDLRVTAANAGEGFTDGAGDFSVTVPDNLPRIVSSALTGSWAMVRDASGPEPASTAFGSPAAPVNVNWTDSNSEASERNAFYHTNVVHDWVNAVAPAMTSLDYEMQVNVNINQSCNAYWDGSTINFYKAGGGCPNIASIADVVYHEYGHGDVQFTFAPASASGSQHEGFADYHGATITDQPDIGRGFGGPGTILRTCDNERVWPAPECGGGAHCLGQVVAGALWHMRENLSESLGHGPGVELSDHLFHTAMSGRKSTFEGYYFDLLAVDDDNGSLLDGTPHDDAIIEAFDRHNIGPGFSLDILHSPLGDTEAGIEAWEISAVFASPDQLIEDSLAVYYSTGPVGGPMTEGPTRLALVSTGDVRTFHAFIPPQPLGTEVRYFLSGRTVEHGLIETLPAGAPAQQFVFRVEVDLTAPQVTHIALDDKAAAIWPVPISAEVTDNQAVGGVQVEWRIDGVDQTPFALSRVGVTDRYEDVFTGTVAEGNVITYRVKGTDAAQAQNAGFDPAVGMHVFTIVHLLEDDGEAGGQDLTHAVVTPSFLDQWHLSTELNHTGGGTTAWKFGDTGNGDYADAADGALVTPEVQLGSGGFFSFWHWIKAEEDTGFRAWDGAVVEITTNGGDDWSVITPVGGYTHTMISNPASPFPGGMPCWSGWYDIWRQAQFDLGPFNGQSIQIRLRFGSDGAVTYEGWYIDDFELDPGGVSTEVASEGRPLRTELSGFSPNPFLGSARVQFSLARADAAASLDVVDAVGRRVRSLVNGPLAAGAHSVVWDGRNDNGHPVGAGVYFVRLQAGDVAQSGKLLRLR